MNENLGDFILSLHNSGAFIDPTGEVLDSSSKSDNPYVAAILKMMTSTNSDPNSEESS